MIREGKITQKKIREMRSILYHTQKMNYHVNIHDEVLVTVAPVFGGGGEFRLERGKLIRGAGAADYGVAAFSQFQC